MTNTSEKKMPKLELPICFMEMGVPRGIYAFKKPNIWTPIVYFRKSKYASAKEYESIIEHIKNHL